jgi:energy-coupling factor transporter ATP-binding protein EcfA2
MLNKIRIQNFRLCKDTTIDKLGQIVALVGRNGAGKSNILQAINAAAKSATGTDFTIFQPFGEPRLSSVLLEMILPPKRYQYELSIQLERRSDNTTKPLFKESLKLHQGDQWIPYIDRSGETVRISGRGPLPIGEASPCLSAIATLLPATDAAVVTVKPVIAFLSAIHYYPLDEPVPSESDRQVRIIAQPEYAKWLTAYESTKIAGDSMDSVLLRILHMYLNNSDSLRILRELIGPNSLGLIDDIRIVDYGTIAQPQQAASPQKAENYYGVWFVPSRGQPTTQQPIFLPYSALSVGTRRIIRMFVVMLFDESTVMLLEQPEDSLHQGMTKKLIGLLRENAASQLVMSSHSSVLLSNLHPDDIQIVSLHDGYTVARHLTDAERNNALTFMNESGPLYDFISSLPED